MKKSLLALALVALSAGAFAAPGGSYGGVRLGAHTSDSSLTSVHELTDGGSVAELFAGRHLTDTTAVEVTLIDLGGQSMQRGKSVGDVQAHALALSAVFSKPVAHDFTLNSEAGVAYSKVNMVGKTSARLAPFVGLGVAYPLSADTSFEVRWKHTFGMGDESYQTDAVTAGVSFKF